MDKHRKARIPKLKFTEVQGIGWHVSYRDPVTKTPRRYRFGIRERALEEEALAAYHRWLGEHLNGETPKPQPAPRPASQEAIETAARPAATPIASVPGSVVDIASGLISSLEARVRAPEERRRQGTIARRGFIDRRRHIRDFLAYLNKQHGKGAVSRMLLSDLSLADVEGYNRWVVRKGYSFAQVNGRMQMVKHVIDRAGRPEHGGQVLSWNWDSRDVGHGKPVKVRPLPTRRQLRKVLAACDLRERTMIWMALGLGFGQQDLATILVGQIDRRAYDLRRSKTGIERYGPTPPLVWTHIKGYVAESSRRRGELLFVTRLGRPLVHDRADSVTQWWSRIRKSVGETKKTLGGFYTLRHLGATEYGSRSGCSIADIRRWLGHSASSQMADVYMRPIPPEYREVVTWVRKRLTSKVLTERSKQR